jgi:hypothetical protein
MKLEEALKKVREENLTKGELENYHLALSGLLADMKIEVSQLKKEKAMFMVQKEAQESIANRKVSWDATPRGQRLLEMIGNAGATKTMVDSIKSRLYTIY